jgi:Tfp pilus assembly protein PilX
MTTGHPKSRIRRADRRRRGVAFVLVIAIMLILLALGTGTLYCGLQHRLLTIRDTQKILARAAADSGLKEAVWQMKHREGSELPAAVDETLSDCSASYSYEVTAGPGGTYTITTTGTSGLARRTVGCRLRPASTLWGGVTLSTGVSLDSRSRIEPLTPGGLVKLQTNSTGSGAVALTANSVVEGNVIIGPHGSPHQVIALSSGGEIRGETLVAEEAVDFPIVVPPPDLPNLGNEQINGSCVLASSGQYNSLEIKGAQVEIAGEVTLYVTGNLTIRTASQLLVRDGARLTLYLGGTLLLEGSSTMGAASLRPEQLQIYGTPTCTRIDIEDSSVACAAIYAPAARCLLNSSSELIGVFAGESLELKSSSFVRYDEAVSVFFPYGLDTLEIDRWWED